MGASLSNPHFLAFADHYNDAQAAGRAPMSWRRFLDTRALGPGDDEAELRSWDMDAHVAEAAAQRRTQAALDDIIVRDSGALLASGLLQNPGDPDAIDRPRDIVFLSCMHVVVCEQCAPRTASCPTCRVPITEKRRIFR